MVQIECYPIIRKKDHLTRAMYPLQRRILFYIKSHSFSKCFISVIMSLNRKSKVPKARYGILITSIQNIKYIAEIQQNTTPKSIVNTKRKCKYNFSKYYNQLFYKLNVAGILAAKRSRYILAAKSSTYNFTNTFTIHIYLDDIVFISSAF